MAFTRDHSAIVSFTPSLAGLGQLKEKLRMEHNGQAKSQAFWQHSRGREAYGGGVASLCLAAGG